MTTRIVPPPTFLRGCFFLTKNTACISTTISTIIRTSQSTRTRSAAVSLNNRYTTTTTATTTTTTTITTRQFNSCWYSTPPIRMTTTTTSPTFTTKFRYFTSSSSSDPKASPSTTPGDDPIIRDKKNTKNNDNRPPPPPQQQQQDSSITTKSEKLRGILNEIGMSISQWKIQEERGDNDNSIASSSPPLGDNRRARRKRSLRQSDHLAPENLNPYVYMHMPSNYRRGVLSSSSTHNRRSDNDFDHSNYYYNNAGGSYGARRKRVLPLILQEEDISARLRVKSVYAASNINITKVLTSVFGPASKTPALRHTFGKTNIIIQLSPSSVVPVAAVESDYDDDDNQQQQQQVSSSSFHDSQPRFVAIFRFGSIVFFNVSTVDSSYILEAVKKHSNDPVPRGFERKDYFEIAINPQMEDTAYVNADFATVKELNINNVAIVSAIMGQTVAFDSYNDTVDELLATFASINSNVKKTGNFTAMERETLFKVVAQNNSLFIDMIAKLGIKDRSDTAWNLSQYERLHEGLKHEFEIEARFDHIEFKLDLIQQNAKFFLEILHNQKSDTLEWIIIILISFECILMLMDMSGVGPSLLQEPASSLETVKALVEK